MTYISFIIGFLSLVKIIPGGKSTLVDRIALILWTALSVLLSAVLLIADWETIDLLSYKISVISIFNLSADYFIPCLNIAGVFPALHYLVSTYPHVLTDKFLPSLRYSWLFLANTALCISAAIATLHESIENSFYFAVNLTATSFWYCLMIISSLTIGICTSQIQTKMEKNDLVLLTKDSASQILQEFQELKAGMSPLLFMVFSSKCIIIIQVLSTLLREDTHKKKCFF